MHRTALGVQNMKDAKTPTTNDLEQLPVPGSPGGKRCAPGGVGRWVDGRCSLQRKGENPEVGISCAESPRAGVFRTGLAEGTERELQENQTAAPSRFVNSEAMTLMVLLGGSPWHLKPAFSL